MELEREKVVSQAPWVRLHGILSACEWSVAFRGPGTFLTGLPGLTPVYKQRVPVRRAVPRNGKCSTSLCGRI